MLSVRIPNILKYPNTSTTSPCVGIPYFNGTCVIHLFSFLSCAFWFVRLFVFCVQCCLCLWIAPSGCCTVYLEKSDIKLPVSLESRK